MFAAYFCSKSRAVLATAWAGVVLVVGHACVHACVRWAVNNFYKDFYNELENAGRLAGNSSSTDQDWHRNQHKVFMQLLEFCKIAAVSISVMPVAKFFRSVWTLRWRLALVRSYLEAWDPNTPAIEGASQRAHEDSFKWASGVELMLTTGLDCVLTLVVFCPILTRLGAETPCPAHVSMLCSLGDAWLVAFALAASLVGLAGTILVGHRLVGIEVHNQRIEAQLRRDLVILETDPSAVCQARPPPEDIVVESRDVLFFMSPLPTFLPTLALLRSNYDSLYLNFSMLNLFLACFNEAMSLAPYFLFAPSLFDPDPSKRIMLGSLIQLSDSFGRVFGAMSVLADAWGDVNVFRATVRRLREFEVDLFGGARRPTRRSTTRAKRALPFASLSMAVAEIPMERVN